MYLELIFSLDHFPNIESAISTGEDTHCPLKDQSTRLTLVLVYLSIKELGLCKLSQSGLFQQIVNKVLAGFLLENIKWLYEN